MTDRQPDAAPPLTLTDAVDALKGLYGLMQLRNASDPGWESSHRAVDARRIMALAEARGTMPSAPSRDQVLEEAATACVKLNRGDTPKGMFTARQDCAAAIRALKESAAPHGTDYQHKPQHEPTAPAAPGDDARDAALLVVPREPTEGMLWAAAKASKDCGMPYTLLQIRDIWRGMLNAAMQRTKGSRG